MESDKKKFTDLIEIIIKNELAATQQQMYELEGQEVIEKLFSIKNADLNFNAEIAKKPYGFNQDSIDIIKEGIEFLSLIVSAFTLYLDYKKYNAEKEKSLSASNKLIERQNHSFIDKSENYSKIEIMKKLHDQLTLRNMPKDLIKTIDKKYVDVVSKFINEL